MTAASRLWRRFPTGVNARHVSKSLVKKKGASLPSIENESISNKRTIYPASVISAAEAVNLLVPGKNSWKIGDTIAKGKWKGFPVYTLTLEERATCPLTCRHWRSCFGNHMNWARRIRHDDTFENRLPFEVARLQLAHPHGFAVRLHVLGDFYSVRYVGLWKRLIETFPALHIFGFTARWERSDPIALALIELAIEQWDRFAIRFSNAPVDECSTVSIEHPSQAPADAVVCPQQIGKTMSCATCAFCWQSKKRVAFVQH